MARERATNGPLINMYEKCFLLQANLVPRVGGDCVMQAGQAATQGDQAGPRGSGGNVKEGIAELLSECYYAFNPEARW